MTKSSKIVYRELTTRAKILLTFATIFLCCQGVSQAIEKKADKNVVPTNVKSATSDKEKTVVFETETPTLEKEDGLRKDVLKVLTHSYSGLDTVELIKKIQERLQWGEKDDLLIEAEGILHWDRDEVHLALPCFRRLNNPSPLTMGLMAEGLMKKNEQYEAAVWFLKSARALPLKDPKAITMYRKYLSIKTDQPKIEMELGARLEAQNRFGEALDVYFTHQNEIAADTVSALRIGKMLSSQGRDKDAVGLFRLSISTHPQSKNLYLAMAHSHEILNHKIDAAEGWSKAWDIDPLDTNARNRAIAHLEAAGPRADTLLKPLIDKALTFDPLSGQLHFKYAVLCLRTQDRPSAYLHLDQALKASPNNITYLSRISEAIEGDSLIRIHFNYLKSRYELGDNSLRLIHQVARGYSLNGDRAGACKAWSQANAIAPQSLENRRDIFQDLSVCTDNGSQSLAEIIADKLMAVNPDRDGLKAIIQITVRNKSWAKAATYSIKLVNINPEEAASALVTAKLVLAATDEANATGLLAAIVEKAKLPEAAFLLGKIYFSRHDCTKAAESFAFATSTYPNAAKLRGQCLFEAKDYQAAVTEFENHFSKTGDKESLRMGAKLYRQLENNMAEKLALETILIKGWASDDEKLRLGRLNATFGDSTKAIGIFSDLLKGKTDLPQDSNWSQAALMVGGRMVKAGNCDQAVKLLTIALKTVPESVANRAEVWMVIGDCHIELSRWKDAFESYSQGVAADPHSINLARGQLQAAKKLNSKQNLEKAYRAIYSLDPSDEDANAFLGTVSQVNKDYKQAVVFFKIVAAKRPSDATAQENLGNALAMIPSLSEAADVLQAALDLGAESDELYINRARAFRFEGNKEMAMSILQFLLTRDTSNYLATLWMAKFAEEDGNQPLAIELFKKTAKLASPKTAWPELSSQGLLEAKVSETQ